MTKTSALRIALGKDAVSIYSSEIFGASDSSRVRDFLSRAFAVAEVEGVELRRSKAFGRVRYRALGNPAPIWQKLGRVLRAVGGAGGSPDNGASPASVDAGLVYLEGSDRRTVHVSRIGRVLSTWQLRSQSKGTLRLSHPGLRNRRDVVFRLEEELAALFGIEEYQASALTGGVSIRFDATSTTPERLVRELERAWPRLLDGLDGPPSRTRLFAASGLVGLAYVGQYLVPQVRPFAVAGVALYSAPNVVRAGKQLVRGQVGVAALYTTGLAFMLATGLPFTAGVMQFMMQLWPHLAHGSIVRGQRRVFAGQRRRPPWVRVVHTDGAEVEVSVDHVQAGDLVSVRGGEVVAVDGVVEQGAAAVVVDAAFAGQKLEDKYPGDPVFAGGLVRDGVLAIRVQRAGADTAQSALAAFLPQGLLPSLPSFSEAERIADRNAKPALVAAALALYATRVPFPAQAIIRPDYATGPRVGAQLAATVGIAHAFQGGVLFRTPSAIDRLGAADVIVIDDSAGLERRGVEVAAVQSVDGVSGELVVGYAAAAGRGARSEQSRALLAFAARRKSVIPTTQARERHAGVTRYRDGTGQTIEVATAQHVSQGGVDVPHFPKRLVRRRAAANVGSELASAEAALRPVWVLREGAIVGVISFTRTGASVGQEIVASLRAHAQQRGENPRIIYLSRGGQGDAETLAQSLGIEHVRGGLGPTQKADLIRGLGRAVLWLGDGSDPAAKGSIAASTTSISVAPLSRTPEDQADILLPYDGLSRLPFVLRLGRAHAARVELDYRTIYSTNLLGVAAALTLGIPPLQVGLLSNLGTGIIYSRHAMSLSRLAHTAELGRARLKRPAAG